MQNIIHTKVINNNILVNNDFIIQGRPQTYLNATVAASAETPTVFSIKGFTAGNYYVLIGEIGSGNAEIVKMHASTAPSGNTITLVSGGVANTHNANESVYFLLYNQAEFSNSSTATGTKSTTGLGNKDLDVTKKWTICPDTTNTSGYAFARFYNSGDTTTYSSYSAAAPYANAAFNTVDYMIEEALNETKRELGGKLTSDFLIKQINECLRDIRRYRNKVSWTQSFQTVLGQTSQGVFRYSPPSDIYDKYSIRAIEKIRLGGEPALEYVDPNAFFNQVVADVHFTQVRTAAAVGATTLEIDNSYDFDDDGSVTVGSQTVSYTGITRSATAGILTGVTGITTAIAVDDWVFQDETTGEPDYWTLYNGYIYIYQLPNSSWDNYNVYIDYFKTVTSVDSLDDAIDYITYDLIKNFLKWKIRAITKNDGIEDLNDPSFVLYKEQLTSLIRKDRSLNRKYFRNQYELGEDAQDINPREIRDGSSL